MAKGRIGGSNEVIEATPKKTSIGCSKNTNYNKARHKKHGKKVYRGQGH